MTRMKPTIGRIVHYKLNSLEALEAQKDMEAFKLSGNRPRAGEVYPALIVRVWGDQETSVVNLQVFLDGRHTIWVTSRAQGELEGQWIWPPKSS